MSSQHILADEDHPQLVPTYPVASVDRALRLITVIPHHGSLTVSEVSRILEVSPSTAHRLLQMFVHHEYLVQGDDRAYRKGAAFKRLSETREPTAPHSLTLRHVIRRLRDELQATVHLMRLEGNSARFVTGVAWQGETDPTQLIKRGWLLPAHTLAGGKAMLSQLSNGALRSLLYPDGIPLTSNGRIRTFSQLFSEIHGIRQRGYARNVEEAHDGIVAIGVPLRLAHASQPMAISAAWPIDRMSADFESRAAATLMTAAESLRDDSPHEHGIETR